MRETRQRRTQFAMVFCLLAAGVMSLGGPATAAPAERYLHVNVQDPTNSGSVNVNLPLSLAEGILPAINNRNLHNGKISLGNADMKGVDVRALLDAVRDAPDGEFVTVKNKDSDIRVAKENGNIIVHVTDKKNKKQRVDVTVPLKIADALFATAKNDELDVAAALQALSDAGNVQLVTVHDSNQKVRIWVDSRSTQD
ncbi:MAG: hypothetical protein ACRD4R_17490 [Candidatus Acidiferrales bacterium]